MKIGRPTKYKPEYDEQAKKLCSSFAATDYDLANFFDVDLSTINRWKLAHPSFCESIKLNKEIADSKIEESLYHRAKGYAVEVDELFHYQGEIYSQRIVKHFPPDPTSMIFWLKNRKPSDWRDTVPPGNGNDAESKELVFKKPE